MNNFVLQTSIVSVLLLTLAGCVAPPGTGVVLLPEEDGTPSTVRVSTLGGESVKLSKPYEQATAVQGAAVVVGNTTAEAVQAAYPEVIALRPAKPQLFVIYFEAGVSELTEQSQKTLGEALALAQSRPGADIVITGHGDTVGDAKENDTLSLRRAQQVRELLMNSEQFKQKSLPADRIEAAGRGERELAVQTADNVAEPRNRRVEILVR